MAKKPKSDPTAEEASAQTVEAATMTEALQDYDGYVQAIAAEVWQFNELPFDLNLEEQLFVRSYVIDRNPVACMRRLGHRSEDPAKLKQRVKKYLATAEVQAAVEFLAKRLMEKLEVTAEKVQRRIAAVAFFDPRDVMAFDKYGVQLVHSRFWTAEQAQAIKKIKMGQNGIEIELYDGMRAAELLGKQLGTIPDDTINNAEAAKAGAEAAMERIFSIFDRVVPNDPVPELPAPEEEPAPETKH